MILTRGEKVHIIQRRLFETDLRRHFLGEVCEAVELVVRVRGYTFEFEKAGNRYVRLPEARERVVSLVDGSFIINILPPHAKCEKATYAIGKDNRLCVTDGETFSLDLNEFAELE
jgi:hypothetical protein